MKRTDEPVVVKQSFDATVEDLWKAVTSPEEMRQWFFDNIPDFKPEEGFKTEFLITNEGREFPHLWEVVEVVPRKKITTNWQFRGYPGESIVIFELSELDGNAFLTVTNEVLSDFPDDIPEFKRESCVGGWEFFIKQRLADFLNRQ